MATVYIAHSRSLLDKAIKYSEDLRDEGNLVYLPGKRVKVHDKGKLLDAGEIAQQHLEAIKGCDECHIFWDGSDPTLMLYIGMAYALGKTIKSCYSAPVDARRFIWERRVDEKIKKKGNGSNKSKGKRR